MLYIDEVGCVIAEDSSPGVLFVFGLSALCVWESSRCLTDVMVNGNILSRLKVFCFDPGLGHFQLSDRSIVPSGHFAENAGSAFGWKAV